MIIVWDEPKRISNLTKHGLDFAEVTEEFFVSASIVPANDDRFMAIGVLGDGTIAVIFAVLGTEGVSIVSMRRASRKERSMLDG